MMASVAIALSLRVAGTVLWLLLSIAIARILSIEDFGLVFFSINVILTGGVIVAVGYNIVVLRVGSIAWSKDRLVGLWSILQEARIVVVIVGLVSTALLVGANLADVSTPVTASAEIATMVGVSMTAVAVTTVHRDALRAANRLQEALLGQSVIRSAVPLVLCMIAALIGDLRPDIAILFFVVGLGASIAFEVWRIRVLALPKGGRVGLSHLSVALTVWPGETAQILFQRSAGIVIGLTAGLEMAAIYLAAERIAQLGVFLTDAVRTVIAPLIARAETQDARRIAVVQSSLLIAVSNTIGALLLLASGGIILWMFGPEFQNALPTLLVLILGQISWTAMGPTAVVLNMCGKESLRSIACVAWTTVQIALLFFCDTALEAAAVFSAVSWGMNITFWLLVRTQLDLTSGVLGISAGAVKELWIEQVTMLSAALQFIRRLI